MSEQRDPASVVEQPQSVLQLESLAEELKQEVPPAKKESEVRLRDWVDWVEFGTAMLEVLLTIAITVMIVYEVFYAKRQDELASRAPQITFSQNSFTARVVPRDIAEHPMELVTPEVVTIYNQGHAALLNGSITAFTDQQDVRITCTETTAMCRTHVEPGYIGPGVDFDLGARLGVSRGVEIRFTIAYMSNHKPFKVRLQVTGDNIEPFKISDLNLDPTMLPPPEK